jgi:UDP-N-acetylmuramate--alanine ligase
MTSMTIAMDGARLPAVRCQTGKVTVSRFKGKRIYLIGIGGCGMSGLARLFQAASARCSGSDSVLTDLTDELRANGIAVTDDQSAESFPPAGRVDLVIASAAIKADHPQMLAAMERGLPILTYAEALGELMADRTGISIAGTHGKSTTTAILAHVLIECGLDPSFIVGATCPQIGGGSRTGAASVPQGPLEGRPGLLIAEACEFNRSFHHHRPHIALINNIEADHLDIYGSLDEVIKAFHDFAKLIPACDDGGRLLIAHDNAHRRVVTAGLACAVSDFGFSPEADYQVTCEHVEGSASVHQEDRLLGSWRLPMPGEHNALNTAAAGIIASWCGAEWSDISRALSTFAGVERRMQRLGARRVSGGEVIVYDDYGHHPTEIDSTLRALRHSVKPERLVCVFQPHQHSRTRFLLEEFATSFTHADAVIVPDIYFVRDSEMEKSKVSSQDLVERLRTRGVNAMHLHPFEAIVDYLENYCRAGDLLVIMGAGPVWKVARQYLQPRTSA